MSAQGTIASDTLDDMKKTDVPPFTLKLRHVIGGRSRIEAAEVVGVPAPTFRTWLSKGSQPAPNQVTKLAKFLGCSIAYLCNDDIPVDADPKDGESVNFTDGELIARLRGRYIEEAERLHDYLDEIQGIDWHDIGGRLLDGYAPKLLKGQDPGSFPPDIERAAEVLSAMRVLIPHTIGPFIPSINTDTVDERLRPEALKRRMDGLAFAQTVRLVMDMLPNLRGLAAAARRGTEHDTSGVARLFDELRAELKEHEASGDHLLETCAGVMEAGGVEPYLQSLMKGMKESLVPKAKTGKIKMTNLADEIGKAITAAMIRDLAQQSRYEAKADQAWRSDAAIKAGGGAPQGDADALSERLRNRAFKRGELLKATLTNKLAAVGS